MNDWFNKCSPNNGENGQMVIEFNNGTRNSQNEDKHLKFATLWR